MCGLKSYPPWTMVPPSHVIDVRLRRRVTLNPDMVHPNAFRFEDYPTATRFDAISDTALDALAQRHAVDFCADYREFLAQRNGYDFATVETMQPVPNDFRLIDYTRYLYGVDTGLPYNDLAAKLAALTKPLGPYLRWCYPIGECRGGDVIVQISQGRFRGTVMLIDHGAFISPEKFQERYARRLEEFHPDKIIPWLCDTECLVALAPSLAQFLGALQVMRTPLGNTNVAIVAGGHVGKLAQVNAAG